LQSLIVAPVIQRTGLLKLALVKRVLESLELTPHHLEGKAQIP